MKLTQATEYGILGLISLSRKGSEPIKIEELANEQKISTMFLKKIFQKLARAKLVEGSRGKDGGFVLLKKIEQISILEVIEAIEGPIAIKNCLKKEYQCCKHKQCRIIEVWRQAQNAMIKVFQNTNLKDL